jgi:hypothetical protein
MNGITMEISNNITMEIENNIIEEIENNIIEEIENIKTDKDLLKYISSLLINYPNINITLIDLLNIIDIFKIKEIRLIEE